MPGKLRYVLLAVLAIAVLAVPLAVMAQEGEEDPGTAYVIVANFSPNAPPVDIYIDGALIAQELAFPAGTYPVEISAGPIWVEVRLSGSEITDAPLVAGEAVLGDGEYYIVPVMNITERAQFGAYLVPVHAALAEGQTRVQFFHSVPGGPRFDVINAVTETVDVPALDFGYVEDPVVLPDMDAGTYHWQVWTNNIVWTNVIEGPNADDPPTLAFDMGELTLEAGIIYSFYIVGSPVVDMPILGLVLAMPVGGGQPAAPPQPPGGTPLPTPVPTSTPTPTTTAGTTITPTASFTPTATFTPSPTSTEPTPTIETGAPCNCSQDLYDCDDFPLTNGTTAQQCFDYCKTQTGRDVHGLDADGDELACE